MNNKLIIPYTSAAVVYVMLRNSAGEVYSTAVDQFTSYITADRGNYALAGSEQGIASGDYEIAVPAHVPAGQYAAVAYEQLSHSPCESDARIAVGQFRWNGSEIVPLPFREEITGGNYALDTDAVGRVRHAVGTGPGELDTTSGAVAVAPEPAIVAAVDDAQPAVNSFRGSAYLSDINSFYVGSLLAFTTGQLKGIARPISAYVGSSRTFSFASPFPAAPQQGDEFIVIGRIEQ